jgi:ribosomal protein S18 acetylase RimI-like enzyme
MMLTGEVITTWPQAKELRRLRNECREFMTGDTAEISTARQVIFYEQQILAGVVRAVLLRRGERAVAYGLLRLDGDGWAMSCGVTASERGQGLGTAVVRMVTAMASDTGKPVRLEVWQDNEAARHAYLRAGYQCTSERVRDGRVIETWEHRQ